MTDVAMRGVEPAAADQAVILLHGRGATADSILALADRLPVDGATFLAPQAADRTWYPHSFLEPVERNEPALTDALDTVTGLVAAVQEAGVSRDAVFLGGFSQGACLALEYAARNADRYGGVFGLSGGLIGDAVDESAYTGEMDGTPVFIGCSDVDPHIPLERVHETASVFEQLHADVDRRIYDGMAHTINDDEVAAVRAMLARKD